MVACTLAVLDESTVMTLVEIAVQEPEDVVTAFGAGADRIELCVDLGSGGQTPSAGLVDHALHHANGRPVHVLVRPRPGDFVYTDAELAVMVTDIRHLASRGVDGIVTGALNADATLDVAALRDLVAAADAVPVTLHRAFDLTPDPVAALEVVLSLGMVRLLTSGGADSAMDGADVIADLVQRAGDAVTVLAGGGITAEAVQTLIARTGVDEVHASARRRLAAAPTGPALGSRGAGGGSREVTDGESVAALVAAVRR